MLFNVGLVINVIFHVITLRSFMVFNGECWVHEVLQTWLGNSRSQGMGKSPPEGTLDC